MESLRIMTLDLRAPLVEEGIAVYALDTDRTGTPDPAIDGYLDEGKRKTPAELRPGKYLFVQIRGDASGDEAAELAIELQKEGLWRRLELEPTLFVRKLAEENGPVTQFMRPIRS